MKLSLRWIFDHLSADWRKYPVEDIVRLFNTKTAEIEQSFKITLHLDYYAVARVAMIDDTGVSVFIPEWKSENKLVKRSDVVIGRWYIVKKNGNVCSWATAVDWGSVKDGLLPAVMVLKNEENGEWKEQCEAEDYILEIDNKSITNRPDMWGHRGVAREIGCLLGIPLIKEEKFLADIPIKTAKTHYKATKAIPVTVELCDPEACDRIAVLPIEKIQYAPSHVTMMLRLLRVDTRAINLVVDTTNYVMHDWGHPLHAFDSDTIASKTIAATMATEGDQLTMLDGSVITLHKKDIVISDGKKPLSLAGIMGGLSSAVSDSTQSLFIEAAHFNPGTIRLSAAHHKIRTEASVRFEKNLSINANVEAILRFARIVQKAGLKGVYASALISLGKAAEPKEIVIEHALIERRLGVELSSDFVKKQLSKLEFDVKESGSSASKKYTIMVPTFRSTKDVTRAEDIIEEVGRLYGWDRIQPELPLFQVEGQEQISVTQLSLVKHHMAFACKMHEVENYAFYDNHFLHKLEYIALSPVLLKNPLSQDRTVLVDSLAPHLLSNVEINRPNNDILRFFEWARVWHIEKDKHAMVKERTALSGIFFDKQHIDFYACKAELDSLFALLAMSIEWVSALDQPWWAHRYKCADIIFEGKKIGTAGMISTRYMEKIGGGQAFAFELDGQTLVSFKQINKRYVPLPKYQGSSFDVTVIVPQSVTVALLKKTVYESEQKIESVALIGTFVKDEWVDKKSVTIRCFVRDLEQTLTKESIDLCHEMVVKTLSGFGQVS